MKVSMMAVMAGLAMCSAAYAGPKTPVASGAGTMIKPMAMAKITKVNGQIRLASDWVAYDQGFGTRGVGELRFDCYGPDQSADSDLPRAPVTSDTCIAGGLPAGSRWYFGTAYNLPHYAEEYKMDDGNAAAGGVVSNLDTTWYMDTAGNAYQFYMIIQFYSEAPADQDLDCFNPETFVGGIIFDFGAISGGGGYYYTNFDGLETLGLEIPAAGSYEVIYAEEFDPDLGYTLPFSYPAQPMIYGTPEDRGETGPGLQGAVTIDDDAPQDGVLDGLGAECYSYSFGICPEPLGRTMGIWTLADGGPGCQVDWNGDGFVDFFDYDDYVNCFETGNCAFPHADADYNGDGFVDFFDYDDFVNAFENGC